MSSFDYAMYFSDFNIGELVVLKKEMPEIKLKHDTTYKIIKEVSGLYHQRYLIENVATGEQIDHVLHGILERKQ